MPFPTKKIKNYFNFNRTEQRGLSVLFLLLLILVGLNLSMPLLFKNEPLDFSEFEKATAQFEQQQAASRDSIHNLKRNKNTEGKADHIKPFEFNPNHLSNEKWRELGLSTQQIEVIKNYEAKGGEFKTAEDLAKIYSISEAEFDKLKPYIRIQNEIAEPVIEQRITPFAFDPNIATRNELLSMGLNEKLVENILNYRLSGGVFATAKDFSKLYALSEKEFRILEPFIEIAPVEQPDPIYDEKPIVMVEINTADTLDLQQLPGIGPSFASRIVKYRELLGGYHHKEQLLEVYGMDSLRYAAIASNITVDVMPIKKININQANIKDLIRHPYIEFYLAKSIVSHREEIGSYHDLKELMNAKLIYKDLYLKIAPYLSLNESKS